MTSGYSSLENLEIFFPRRPGSFLEDLDVFFSRPGIVLLLQKNSVRASTVEEDLVNIAFFNRSPEEPVNLIPLKGVSSFVEDVCSV